MTLQAHGPGQASAYARRKARGMTSDAAGHLDALVGGLAVAISTRLPPCREKRSQQRFSIYNRSKPIRRSPYVMLAAAPPPYLQVRTLRPSSRRIRRDGAMKLSQPEARWSRLANIPNVARGRGVLVERNDATRTAVDGRLGGRRRSCARLTTASALRLPVRAPFHLEATVRVLQRRPANLIDTWDGDNYRRVVRWADRVALLEVNNAGTIDVPDLRLTIGTHSDSARDRKEAARAAREILGLEHDPAAAQRHAEAEPALRETASALRGMRPPRYPDLF